ncbi:MAG: Rpn family recombination-promoting nuclease/putative transposase [Bacteroidales bacterium]|nr:Rpn family recombination-promoting nuclease/putative transposase [Bacteroidales bacterium]
MAKREVKKYVWFDWAMKHILCNKANFVILEGFISAITGENMKITGLEGSEGNQEKSNQKFNRVDVRAVNDKGEKVIIEVQTIREMDFIERMLFGAANTVKEQVDLGHPYKDIHKVYTISVVYFGLGQGKDYLYKGQAVLKGVHTHDTFTFKRKTEQDTLITLSSEDIFPVYYLVRVGKFDYKKVTKNSLEQWMNYLKTGEIGEDDDAPGLPEARNKLQYDAMPKAEQKVYRDFLDSVYYEQEALDDSFAEGVALGEAKREKEMASMMKDNGEPIEKIMLYTGLSADEIKNL